MRPGARYADLSMESCPLRNQHDQLAMQGPGAQLLEPGNAHTQSEAIE